MRKNSRARFHTAMIFDYGKSNEEIVREDGSGLFRE
jgi:hypothetical protein